MLPSFEIKAQSSFPVVGIGGSAGSLRAYLDILGEMPINAGMAIVIVAHRPLNDADRFLTLLAKATHMEVVEVTDGMRLTPGCIFVTPAHREITTDGVVLKLAAGLTNGHGWPTSISTFLLSLANGCTSRAIAIIISGLGHDGSCALAAVKGEGGWTLAQSDAQYLDMPRAAIDTEHVDLFLSSVEIGKYLASLSAHLRINAG